MAARVEDCFTASEEQSRGCSDSVDIKGTEEGQKRKVVVSLV